MEDIIKNIIRDGITDDDIIEELKKGHKDLYAIIIKKYNQFLYRVALSYGINDDDCDDIIQQTYINAYEKLDQFKGEAKFKTWLTKILINECLMFKRKEKRNQNRYERIIKDDDVTSFIEKHQNPEINYIKMETSNIIEKAINKLPEKLKSVFILREVENLNVKETSDILNISEVNVKIRLHRGKALLRKFLMEEIEYKEVMTFGNERCDNITENVIRILNPK